MSTRPLGSALANSAAEEKTPGATSVKLGSALRAAKRACCDRKCVSKERASSDRKCVSKERASHDRKCVSKERASNERKCVSKERASNDRKCVLKFNELNLHIEKSKMDLSPSWFGPQRSNNSLIKSQM